MPMQFSTGSLRYIAADFSRRLGAAWAPSVRIVPGVSCYYSPFLHRVSMGAELLNRASTATSLAILAHEVGHACQPELRQRRWCLWLLLVCIILACLPALAAVWVNLHGPAGMYLAIAPMSLIPVSYFLTAKYMETQENNLELEFDADVRSAELVGREAALAAMVEYADLFTEGYTTPVGKLRYDRLHTARLSPKDAPGISQKAMLAL